MIGDLALGGVNPVRIQSMTTTDTMDTIGTVEQSIRMIDAGCELVRITAPSINEARNLENIKNELRKRGYQTPLVADIHFTPNAAEVAARIVEKVRINPGNFADKKKFEDIEYTDAAYSEELDRIRTRFIPLVKICKEYGTAMRIGTNHGSLSDRIMSRYGDTPLGMVESALEFLRICESEGYKNIVLSMKSSNPQVMVQAYRLLIKKMHAEQMNYPLHLGVTEAGEGEDGRIKSAAGIGTLLEDGIGDTIRVSLTEDPEFEIPVAKALVERYSNRSIHTSINKAEDKHIATLHSYEYIKRKTNAVVQTGGENVPRVVCDLSRMPAITPASLFGCGYAYSVPLDKWNLADQACDFIYTGKHILTFNIPGTLAVICDYDVWKDQQKMERHYPIFSWSQYHSEILHSPVMNFININEEDVFSDGFKEKLQSLKNVVLVVSTSNEHAMPALRRMFLEMNVVGNENCPPVIIKRTYNDLSADAVQLYASTDFGGLFLDGCGDGIWINGLTETSVAGLNALSFGILQACRQRISKTEYISCPSCGRTLFNLQETTAKIRSRTSHLKGIKIGIMGCIVNGPGEMADADYGYVGSGAGKITLYKGREVVMRNVDTELAVDALINLIKEHGDWVEVPEMV